MNHSKTRRPGELEPLLFRRQFLLGPKPIEGFPGWTRIALDGEHHLAAHPDLHVHQSSRGGKSITLLGYILDPDNPKRTNAEVVDALLDELGTFDALISSTSRLGGRWILVAHDGADTTLFHDAGGLRQICYSRSESSDARKGWCASQPGLIAEALKLEVDRDAADFLNGRETCEYFAYWLPGDISLYEEVKVLLPNHCLNLGTGVARRYWPDADLARLEPREGVEKSSRLLRGLMAAARQRFDMALPMTAGWDSRLMLALSKDFFRDLYCYTFRFPGYRETINDIVVPAALTKRLGVPHHVIRCPEKADADFEAVYRRNNTTSINASCGDAQALFDLYPKERVCVGGDVAEVVKCFFRLPESEGGVMRALDLAEFDALGTSPLVLRAYEKWLAGAHPRNVHLLDLFCWEQMAGRVQALLRSQYDLVQECFAPFNCRDLLVTMLSVNEDYRRPPECRLLRDLIEELWPELLSEPINPPNKKTAMEIILGTLARWQLWRLIPRPVVGLGKRVFRSR